MAWPHPMTLVGVAGGAVAVLVVASAANALHDGPPPAVEPQFWARTVAGTHQNDAVNEGFALHVLWGGALLGGLYPWCCTISRDHPASTSIRCLPEPLRRWRPRSGIRWWESDRGVHRRTRGETADR